MRHLHFTQSLEPLQGGGLGSSALTLHRQLMALGFESRLCATFGRAAQCPVERSLELKRRGPGFLYFSPELSRRADPLVAEADVVHGHGLYVGTNYAFGRAARRQHKPLVYHVHGMFEPYILRRSRWKKRIVHWLFEDANFRHVRLWRALTDTEADQIRACGICTPIVVVPNGVAVEDLERAPKNVGAVRTPWVEELKKEKLRVLFLGRLHPKKGLGMLLSAWAELSRYHSQWELILAGPDELGHLAALRQLTRSLAIEPQIQFTGPVAGQIKSALLHSADLFVLPSHSEGFSMGLLEAMSCGLPVLATQACHFPQITSREAGWECEASPSALKTTLAAALEATPEERRQRGRNGRRLVEQQYSWPRIIQTLLEACRTCC